MLFLYHTDLRTCRCEGFALPDFHFDPSSLFHLIRPFLALLEIQEIKPGGF